METFVRSALIFLVARVDEQTGGIGVAILVEHEVRFEPLHAHVPDVAPGKEERGDPVRRLDPLDHHRLAGAALGNHHDILEHDRPEPGEGGLCHLDPAVEVGDVARHPRGHP